MIPRDKFSYEFYKPQRNPRFCNLIGPTRLEEIQINLNHRELKNWVLCLKYLFFIDYLDDTYWLYWLFWWYILASKKQIFSRKKYSKTMHESRSWGTKYNGEREICHFRSLKRPKRAKQKKCRENVLVFFKFIFIGSRIYSYFKKDSAFTAVKRDACKVLN